MNGGIWWLIGTPTSRVQEWTCSALRYHMLSLMMVKSIIYRWISENTPGARCFWLCESIISTLQHVDYLFPTPANPICLLIDFIFDVFLRHSWYAMQRVVQVRSYLLHTARLLQTMIFTSTDLYVVVDRHQLSPCRNLYKKWINT